MHTVTNRQLGGRAAPVAPAAAVVLAAIILGALLLRGPIVAVAPVVDLIRQNLGLSAAEVGWLTGIPVLCFALFTPFALWATQRLGPNAALTLTLVGVAAGIIIRSSGGTGLAFAGTVVIGAFVAVGNLVIPVIIRREFAPERVGFATGIYTSALNVGSMITTLTTAPIAGAIGWQGAIGIWALIGLIALAAWVLAVGPRPAFVPLARDHGDEHLTPVWRSLTALLLVLAFSGQAFGYYGITAWLPTILAQRNGFTMEGAGSSASVFQVMAIVGALGIPFAIARLGRTAAFIVAGTLWSTVPLGLLFAPHLWLLWAVCGGAAQGAGITIIITATLALASGDRHAARLTAIVQALGYTVAALAPSAIGLAHESTGDWTAPLLILVGGVVLFVGAGVAANSRITAARSR
jgi:MFS transporter, CP family, cyanate transporter